MILMTIFASSFVIALSGAMMPGTLLTVAISESSKRGVLAGPLLILGHGILEVVLLAALFMGMAPLFKEAWFFIFISIAGGSILLWMAAGMFRSLPTLTLSLEPGDEKSGNIILTGILMSAANPYFIIWWATIGLGYILQSSEYGLAGILSFFSGHILADLTWYTIISTAVGKGRSFLSDKVYRGIIGCCAGFLVLFSVYLFFGVIRYLRI
ncbi:MAG: LysE family transporter [Deltaproteobacteria bacterium]|nr:LysE family transporter [Candidatus Desulfobacula maris]